MCCLLNIWACRIYLLGTARASNGVTGTEDGAKLLDDPAAMKKARFRPQAAETGTLPA
jgi:hypothetical protein